MQKRHTICIVFPPNWTSNISFLTTVTILPQVALTERSSKPQSLTKKSSLAMGLKLLAVDDKNVTWMGRYTFLLHFSATFFLLLFLFPSYPTYSFPFFYRPHFRPPIFTCSGASSSPHGVDCLGASSSSKYKTTTKHVKALFQLQFKRSHISSES